MGSQFIRCRALSTGLTRQFRISDVKHNIQFSSTNLKTYFAKVTSTPFYQANCYQSRSISSSTRPLIFYNIPSYMEKRHASSDKSPESSSLNEKQDYSKVETVSKVQMLKKAVAEYGSTVIIFHVTISLMSLGICYALVSSGVDASQVFLTLGLAENKIAASAGTFVAAYAVHKVMAPIRISITLGATPFIVRYLRNKGILKK